MSTLIWNHPKFVALHHHKKKTIAHAHTAGSLADRRADFW